MYSNGGIYIPDRKPPMGARRNPYLKINQGIVLDSMMWEGAGPTVEDLSGNGNAGTFQGTAPSWSSGKSGPAVSLPGTDEYINIPDSPVLSFPSGGMSIVVRFKSNEAIVDADIVGKYANPHEYLIGFSGGDLYWFVYDQSAGALRGRSTTGGFAANTWYDVVGTYDGGVACSGLKIYKNAIQVDTDDFTAGAFTAMENTASALLINLANWDANYLNIEIEFLYLYNRDLSPPEIVLICREPFCGFRWPNIMQLAAYVAAGGTILPQITNAYMKVSA